MLFHPTLLPPRQSQLQRLFQRSDRIMASNAVQQLNGTLFRWGEEGVKVRTSCGITKFSPMLPCVRLILFTVTSILQVGFRCGDHPRQVVFLGGLTDGLMPTRCERSI